MYEGVIPVPFMFELAEGVVLNIPTPVVGKPDRMGWEDLFRVAGGEERTRSLGFGVSELAAARWRVW